MRSEPASVSKPPAPTRSLIDTEDGQKIVRHVFGDQTDGVVSALSGGGGGQASLVKMLLPLLAPIVMSYLSRQRKGGSDAGGLDVGDLLGGLLGGSKGGSAGAGGLPGGLGDLLGGLLGGGRR